MSHAAAEWLSAKLSSRGESYPGWLVATGCALVAGAIVAGVAERPSVGTALIGAVALAPWAVAFNSRVHIPVLVKAGITTVGAFAIAHGSNHNAALFAVVWMVGEVATDCNLPESLVAFGAASGTLLAYVLNARLPVRPGFVAWIAATGVAWMVGRVFRHQQMLVARLRDAQEALGRQAALQERQRIAREIHDVVAHSLAVTMLHLTGARKALHRDRAEAEAALLEAERLGRQSMADIRRTVGLLASGTEGNGTDAPLPSARDIPTLVAQYRQAALDVSLSVRGDLSDIALTVGLGLYRIVDESLANAVRHAPGGNVTILLELTTGSIRLTIRSRQPELVSRATVTGGRAAPSVPPGGLGVTGMIQRASLLGGTLTAGPEGAGWTVDAVIPVEDA